MKSGWKCAALAAAVAALSGASIATAAPSIGINFSDDVLGTGDSGVQNSHLDSLLPAESAGAPGYTQTNWNNFGRWGNPTPANDSTGAATPVSAGWDSGNTWAIDRSTTPSLPTPDSKLMNGYIDSNGAANTPLTSPYRIFDHPENKPIVYVNGLSSWLSSVGATSYKVVLYTDGDGTDNRVGQYWLQGATGSDVNALTVGSDLTAHLFNNDNANFSGTYNLVGSGSTSADVAQSGNYMVFDGLNADSFLIRADEVSGGNLRSPINGFQIVAVVPEPATIGLLGIGALGLLVRRRRA